MWLSESGGATSSREISGMVSRILYISGIQPGVREDILGGT